MILRFVGIGVPILLAYVYGVVPISLCRSGGCGVTATNKGGVRFEFDEENETVGPAGPGKYLVAIVNKGIQLFDGVDLIINAAGQGPLSAYM